MRSLFPFFDIWLCVDCAVKRSEKATADYVAHCGMPTSTWFPGEPGVDMTQVYDGAPQIPDGPPLEYGRDWAGTRAELEQPQFPTERAYPGPDLARVHNLARDAWQRLVEHRIAAGYAAEEATIRAELVVAIRDAIASEWEIQSEHRTMMSRDFDPHDGIDMSQLAEAAVGALVEFISKPREVKSATP